MLIINYTTFIHYNNKSVRTHSATCEITPARAHVYTTHNTVEKVQIISVFIHELDQVTQTTLLKI